MGITWLTGNSGAGKTTTAIALKNLLESQGRTVCLLDGDEVRARYKEPLGFSKAERWKHNINVAEEALAQKDNYDAVIVAVICPYKALRKKIKKLTKCKFIYIDGGKEGADYPYDKPKLY
jgi:adenylylsulfate kinase